jgi:hypothetical protein
VVSDNQAEGETRGGFPLEVGERRDSRVQRLDGNFSISRVVSNNQGEGGTRGRSQLEVVERRDRFLVLVWYPITTRGGFLTDQGVEETREEEGKKTESVGGGGGRDAEGVLKHLRTGNHS